MRHRIVTSMLLSLLFAAASSGAEPAAPAPSPVVPLLAQSKFTELDRALRDMAGRRADCAARGVCEYADAVSALTRALADDETLRPYLDAWLRASKAPFAELVHGEYETVRAWAERGTGYSNSVAPDAWPRFFAHLAAAEGAYRKSQQIDPHAPDPMVGLVYLALYQQKGLAEVKRRFDAAVALDPGSDAAHRAMLLAVSRRWGGSDEAELAFARMVAAAHPDSPDLGLLVLQAHVDAARSTDERRYWRDPVAWSDGSAALERYLAKIPESSWAHNRLARLAYVAGKKEVAVREFKWIGDAWHPSVWQSSKDGFTLARFWALGTAAFSAAPAAPAE